MVYVSCTDFLFKILLLTFISSCSMKEPRPAYINYKIQEDYPSGSTISYLNGVFYIMGDDASEILVLNEFLGETERLQIFPKGKDFRIPKLIKADIEASAVINHNDREGILFLGSGSLIPHRDSAFLFDPINKKVKKIDYTGFYDQLRTQLKHLNIEAAAVMGGDLILGIRANTSYPDNYLVVATSNIAAPEFKRNIHLKLPVENSGISGMDYDQQNDILFMTFSSESTPNAVDDGQAGESYLAIISDATGQLQNSDLTIPSFIKLTDLSSDFIHQKIESVSLIKGKRQLLLVADDDRGNTKFFRLDF